MKVSFGGLGECVATFYNNETNPASPGDLVKISASGEVSACLAGDEFIGVCISADSEFAAVQLGGFVTLPYAGTAPDFGGLFLTCADQCTVQASSDGTKVIVIEENSTEKTIGILL